MDNLIFTSGAIVLYLACSALLFFNLKRSANESITAPGLLSRKKIIAIGLIALCLHALALHNSLMTPIGIDLGFYNAMSLVSAVIILLILIAELRYPVDILAVVLLPTAAVSMLIDSFNSTHHLLPPGSSDELIFHILTSIIAYSILALAALQAILLSIQNKFLHAHQPGGFIKLMPPLNTMEVLLFEVLTVGFIALTISLGSGMVYLDNMFEQQLAHKTILSIIAWFVFLTLLIGRWKLGWRGRTAIRWTLTGFASLMLAYFGSKFVLEIVLA